MAEGAVQLPVVAVTDEGGVVAEGAVQEEELPEAMPAEEGGEGQEGHGGEARRRELDQLVQGDRGGRGWRADVERGGGGKDDGEGHEGSVGGGPAAGGGVVEGAPFQADAEVAELVVDDGLGAGVRRVQ